MTRREGVPVRENVGVRWIGGRGSATRLRWTKVRDMPNKAILYLVLSGMKDRDTGTKDEADQCVVGVAERSAKLQKQGRM